MSPKIKDLTGKRFGKLIVLRQSYQAKGRDYYWLCLCDCGNQKEILGRSLRGGCSKSCGCLQKEKARESTEDLSGNQFGRWCVIKREGLNIFRQSTWLCLCVCGNYKIVPAIALRRGKSKSCGCLNTEIRTTRFYKHGLSQTVAYKQIDNNKRREDKGTWSITMEQELTRLYPICVLCGKQGKLETDHVYPLSKGYNLKPGNAVKLCRSCNAAKKDRVPDNMGAKGKLLLYYAEEFKSLWESITNES